MQDNYEGLINLILEKLTDILIEKLEVRFSHVSKPSDDPIFDVKGVCEYLHVTENWIYQRTRRYEIPFYKKGKYCFFRKSEIDKWLNEDAIKPLLTLSSKKRQIMAFG